jgi:N-acetylmuramoyl-L-alanine amidase
MSKMIRFTLAICAAVFGVAMIFIAATTIAAVNPTQSPFSPPLAGKVILVDPGHGGKDSGALQSCARCGLPRVAGHSYVQEADLNLAMALLLRDELQRLGATVYLTRESDVYTPNDDRVLMQADVSLTPRGQREHVAQRPADISVSIHVNSAGPGLPASYDGIEIYSYYAPGNTLAQAVAPMLEQELGKRTRHIHPKGFRLIDHNPLVPTILIETGYISHPATCRDLASAAYQGRIAAAVAHGVLSYFQTVSLSTQAHLNHAWW